MFLSTVLASVNDNEKYYMFVPKQIHFWKKFNIRFLAVFVGEKIPDVLQPFAENIILYDRNLDLHSAYVAQNVRMYYPALLSLPENDMVMITDMDMLPTNDSYFKDGLDQYTIDDFIYYRHVEGNQIFMCYNAAHPSCWSKVFGVKTVEDVENEIKKNYNANYDGNPGTHGWNNDQEIMYQKLIDYKELKILNRPLKRIEKYTYIQHLMDNDRYFISRYDDFHAHRDYYSNKDLIEDAERQLGVKES